jgi:molybdenum cofactor sulfurtransferase
MQSTLLANPHSDASNPSASSVIVAETRLRVLQFFKADPEHFDVVFTANATAAIKLVMESFSGHEAGFDYCYHRNCHTSLVGVREVARRSTCFATDKETEEWIDGTYEAFDSRFGGRPTLFAFPAQSNMNGQRLPLNWANRMRATESRPNTYSLLDAAAFVCTSPLDLSNHIAAPDFVAMSFYKIFGFPDLGALIVRKASAHILENRKYFGGGTTEMVTCFSENPWVERKESSIHARLEDGTIAIRSILALRCAIDNHQRLFGGMEEISKHSTWLAKILYDRLSTLRHGNEEPLCQMYTAVNSRYGDATTQGATIAFNMRKSDGSWMGPYGIGAKLRARNIHVRTGSVCNPAGMACALNRSDADMRMAFDQGFRCNQQDDVVEGYAPFGVVRVTLGAMSTLEDVNILAKFVENHLVDRSCKAQSVSTFVESTSIETDREKMPSILSKPEIRRRQSMPSKRWAIARRAKDVFLNCFRQERTRRV